MIEEAQGERGAQPIPGRWKRHAPEAALAALFVTERLILLANTYAISVDGVRYLSLGRLWTQGRVLEAMATQFHPLYPLLLGFATAPFSRPELPGHLLSVLFSALTMIPLYRIGKALGGRPAALATLALFAVVPHPLRLSVEILSEPLYLLLLAWECAFVLDALAAPRLRTALLAGLFAAAAYYTRPEGVLPLAAYAAAALLPTRDGARLPRRLSLPLAAVAAFLLLAAPYMGWAGGFTPKKSLARLAGSGDFRPDEPLARPAAAAPAPEAPSARVLLPSWGMAGLDPDHAARAEPVRGAPWKAVVLFGKAGHFIATPLAALGFLLALALGRWDRSRTFLLVLLVLELALVTALLWAYRYASLRHGIPAAVIGLPLAATAVVDLWALGGRRAATLARGGLLLAGLAFVIFFHCQSLKPLRHNRRHLKRVAAELMRHAKPSDLVLSDDPRIAWYAGTRFMALGMTDAAGLEREASRTGARFLVMDRGELRRRIPDFEAGGTWRERPVGDGEKPDHDTAIFARIP